MLTLFETSLTTQTSSSRGVTERVDAHRNLRDEKRIQRMRTSNMRAARPVC